MAKSCWQPPQAVWNLESGEWASRLVGPQEPLG